MNTEAVKRVGDQGTQDDFEATRHVGDVRTLDDFEARWAERRRAHPARPSERTDKAPPAAHRRATVEHRQEKGRTAPIAGATAAKTAPGAQGEAPARWLHHGVITGTVKEQSLRWTNRETGETKMVPRLVLVSRMGDEALLPLASQTTLAPFIGKLAKITCDAIVVPPGPATGGHHNLVVEQIQKVDPYSAGEEAAGSEAAPAVATPAVPEPRPSVPPAPGGK